jgi:DNA-binding beta-propeller fold protein YncE
MEQKSILLTGLICLMLLITPVIAYNIDEHYKSELYPKTTTDTEKALSPPFKISGDNTAYLPESPGYIIQDAVNGYRFNKKWGSEIQTGELWNPRGISVNTQGNVYVADSLNNRVQIFSSSGVYQAIIGSYGHEAGDLYEPFDLFIDRSGNTFVADSGNDRIQKFSPEGTSLAVFGTEIRDYIRR